MDGVNEKRYQVLEDLRLATVAWVLAWLRLPTHSDDSIPMHATR